MTVLHGRHEMPGWRGYLPDSIDRASRGAGRRGRLLRRRGPRRVVAVGALAACVVAGGAVATQTRSVWRPDPAPGPADTSGSVLARSSAWLREAAPVLGAVELEIRRAEGVRRQWVASSTAQRGGPPPGAVVALLGRHAALERHRATLRAATDAVRADPASEPLLAGAQQQLRAAEQMLGDLVAGRGVLGDPTEAAVLRLVDDRSNLAASGSDRPPVQAVGASVRTGPVRSGAARLVAAVSPAVTRPVAAGISSTASPEERSEPSPVSSAPSGGAEDTGADRSFRSVAEPAPDAPEVADVEDGRASPLPSAAPPADEPAAPPTDEPAASSTDERAAPPERAASPVDGSMMTFGATPPDDLTEVAVRQVPGEETAAVDADTPERTDT